MLLNTKQKNPYKPHKVRILDVVRETYDSVTLTLDISCNHEPGQYFQFNLPFIGEAPISICSYSKKHVMINIRQVGDVTNAAAKLSKHDKVYVRGPYGKGYPMEKLVGKNLVIVGGGSGVAPLRAIIEYLEQHKEKYPSPRLFFGFRNPAGILFKKDMEKWKKSFDLNLSVDKNENNEPFDGKVCFVTKLLEKADISAEKTVAFVCGPPIMMQFVINILKKKGFSDDQIYLSTERLLNCGIGKCGHCMIHGKYSCLDGPVFRFDEISRYDTD